MNTEWMKGRQTRYSAYLTTYILVVLAVLVLVNWLANRHNKSVDTTANKRFSLSDQTHKIVRDLKQDLRITYFDNSEGLQRGKDLLDRYDLLSPKLSVDYIDPDKKPTVARAAGITTYGTTVIRIGDKREEAKSLTEEEVTGAMIRALKGGQRTVCSVSGSGEHTFEDSGRSGYSSLKDSLERNNYRTRTISLLEKAEVPQDCSVVLVAGPKFDYVETVVNAIKSHVDRGGAALIMLDAPIKSAKDAVADNDALAAVLAGWGVTANKDLAIDLSGIGKVLGFSEVVPLVTTYESHAIVREMRGIATAFSLPRTLEVKSPSEKLFSTSENSFATSQL
ncbi:MAG TPA: GldG family protein, partial [Bryobacteraceae bacterium]|nr:GldG family protein [Bryobacteraceae bacterium]